MRKVAAMLLMLFSLAVLVASTSTRLMKAITNMRENAPWGAWYGNHHVAGGGDLLRMAYLEGVPRFRDTNREVYTQAPTGNQSVNLYLWGDSYVKNIPDSAFYGLRSFHFGRRDFSTLMYHLDTSQTNILILSIAERFVRTVFASTDVTYRQVKRETSTAASVRHFPYSPARATRYASILHGILPDYLSPRHLFNTAINQNIEYNLFSYNIVSPIRVFKATMTEKLFRRATGDVVISDDGSRLFLRQTVMPTGGESAYEKLGGKELAALRDTMNAIYAHYRAEGFDEVYFSLLPNPVSMIQPQYYNRLIPQLQQGTYAIQAPCIDVYSHFRHHPAKYYLRDDTHWNEYGRTLWLQQVNTMLRSWDE